MSWVTPHTIPLYSSLPHPKVTKETKQKPSQETKQNQTKKTNNLQNLLFPSSNLEKLCVCWTQPDQFAQYFFVV